MTIFKRRAFGKKWPAFAESDSWERGSRSGLISRAMFTPEGRTALSEAMIAPIREARFRSWFAPRESINPIPPESRNEDAA